MVGSSSSSGGFYVAGDAVEDFHGIVTATFPPKVRGWAVETAITIAAE
jgi:hypothetical protein